MTQNQRMLTDQRVVLNFRTRLEVHASGHHQLRVEALGGGVAAVFDGPDSADVERQLRQAGYQRISPGIADEIDLLRLFPKL